MTYTVLAVLFFYFIALTVLSFRKRTNLPGKSIFLLRAFFPSWRFFEDLGDVPVLWYRVARVGTELGNWQNCTKRLTRRWHGLLLNPQGNLLLASGSLLQQLLSDVEQVDEKHPERVEKFVSYQLTRNLVRHQISEMAGLHYQFKLSAGSGTSCEDVLISPVYEN
jgi:hypothetical protein